MSSKINLQTCEYACKSSIFQDNQLICLKNIRNIEKEKIYLSNGDTIQISRRKKQDTIVRYNEFVIRNAK